MSFRIDGQVAIVTGGGRDIGRAIALDLARNGADVVVHYLRSEVQAGEVVREIEGMGRRAIRVRADVTRADEVASLVDRAVDFGGGRIDILVNNAGGMEKRTTILETDEDLFDRTVDLNLKSVFLVSRAVLAHMVKRGRGKIVNISSVAGHQGGSVNQPHYAPAKAAVSNLTRTLAKEFAAKGIQVNAIAPGIIDTDFHRRLTPPDVMDGLMRFVPMGRMGTPEEVAGAAVFLASPASNYVTGEVIHVNGGMYFGS